MKKFQWLSIFCAAAGTVFADISISIDAQEGVRRISPYLYGLNANDDGHELTDTNTAIDSKDSISLINLKEAGVRMLRMNQGNNATKYNWRKKISSHPDWYNNVQPHDWDITAKKILDHLPGVDAIYGFQLAGYAASNNKNNFADWDYYINHNNTWAPQTLNLAGGGSVDDAGNLISAGDYSKYLEPWSADSTVGILKHWKNLGYDMSRFQYWSMDNEPEIWAGTHDDLPYDYDKNSSSAADRIIDNYIATAKLARQIYPEIKLMGPVVANEWYWCNVHYGNGTSNLVPASDKNYCWLEYFIKRIAEAEKASGVKMLDVFDIHWYPTEKNFADLMNLHRVFFDTTYIYPGANGIKRVNGAWDNSIQKEYIFKRISDWLNQYFGENNSITFALTETSLPSEDAMTIALIYASFMGTFADNGVEIFTPWTWKNGMFEVLHLFSRYAKEFRVQSNSSNDSLVSAYSSVNAGKDSLTIILVNRAESAAQTVNLNLSNITLSDGTFPTLSLSGLSGETFVSHTNNALKSGNVSVSSNKLNLSLPAKSITAVLLSTKASESISPILSTGNVGISRQGNSWFIENPAGSAKSAEIFNHLGQRIYQMPNLSKGSNRIEMENLSGKYLVRIHSSSGKKTFQIVSGI